MVDIAIAVLAAGAGRRLGKSKHRVILAGQSLLERALTQATATRHPVYTVLGSEAEACRQTLDAFGVRGLENPRWSAGMGSSIHIAVQAICHAQPEIDAILFMLVDQPAVTSNHLNRLISHYRQERKIIASTYADTVGVPTLFPREYFAELALIAPQEGARSLLQRHAENLLTVPLTDGERDIDTLDDFHYWQARLELEK